MKSSDDDEEKKILPAVVDGFDDAEDRVEGEDEQHSGRVIQGEKLTFSNDFVWLAGDDEEIPQTLELCVIDTQKVVQKWIDQVAVDIIWVPPQQKWPDIDKLNDACPKTEWRKDFNGNLVGPWQRSRVTYFVNLDSMQKYTWPTGTVGGDICIRDFRDRVKMMRKLRGERVFAIVTLGDCYMSTRFGGRQRPDLKIVRWIILGPDGRALSGPTTPSLPPATNAKAHLDQNAKSAESTKREPSAQAKPTMETPSGIPTVDPPSLSEHMGNDRVPW
jgi:hypothetical protein